MRGVPTSALLCGALLLLTGCGQDDKPAPTSRSEAPTAAPVASSAADAAKGKQVWVSQCVVCHNSDPAKDGPIGPAVKGASRDVIAARVLHASYPPGYTPKRNTRVMPARPDLVASIPDLAAFLQ